MHLGMPSGRRQKIVVFVAAGTARLTHFLKVHKNNSKLNNLICSNVVCFKYTLNRNASCAYPCVFGTSIAYIHTQYIDTYVGKCPTYLVIDS
jgi:hypothetical protein